MLARGKPKEQPKEGVRLEHSRRPTELDGRAAASRGPAGWWWAARLTPARESERRQTRGTSAPKMMRRLAALVALLTAFSSAQMQKSREVRSHEEYHKKRQDQLNRKAQSRKNALKKGGTQSKTLHELRMKKQHKNRAKKQAQKKRRPGL